MTAQAAQALLFANERRSILKELRVRVAALGLVAGCELVSAVLADPTDHEAAMPIGRLLLSINRFGPGQLAFAVRDAGILTADKRIRDLTDRQRTALGLVLQRRASLYRSKSHTKIWAEDYRGPNMTEHFAEA